MTAREAREWTYDEDVLADLEGWLEENPDEFDPDELFVGRDVETGETLAPQYREPERPRMWDARVKDVRPKAVLSSDAFDATHKHLTGDTSSVDTPQVAGLPWRQDSDNYPTRKKLMLKMWRARLEFLLQLLKPHQREVLEAVFFLGKSYAAVARSRGTTYQAVQNVVKVALQDLRRLVVKHREDVKAVELNDEQTSAG